MKLVSFVYLSCLLVCLKIYSYAFKWHSFIFKKHSRAFRINNMLPNCNGILPGHVCIWLKYTVMLPEFVCSQNTYQKTSAYFRWVFVHMRLFKGTLMQIWKSVNIFVFIWKHYVGDFTLKQLLLFEICAHEKCEKFVYKHSETIEYVKN